ncbi:hypothetical protein QOT17_017798 [Balamuthia mandrillaris]
MARTAFFLVLILAASLASFTHAEEWEWKQTLTVTGEAVVEVEADDAKVFLGVEVFAKTADQAQDKAALLISYIVNFLKNQDNVEDIETAFFDIRPVIKYNKLAGFVAVHILSFKVKDLEKLGFIIDGAIYAGANRVDFIKFLVDKDDFKEAQEDALEKALLAASKQAEVILDALDLEFEKILKVEVVSVDIIKGKFGNEVDWSYSSSTVDPGQQQLVKAVVRATVKWLQPLALAISPEEGQNPGCREWLRLHSDTVRFLGDGCLAVCPLRSKGRRERRRNDKANPKKRKENSKEEDKDKKTKRNDETEKRRQKEKKI